MLTTSGKQCNANQSNVRYQAQVQGNDSYAIFGREYFGNGGQRNNFNTIMHVMDLGIERGATTLVQDQSKGQSCKMREQPRAISILAQGESSNSATHTPLHKEVNQSKKMKSPPFYISLVIGDKIVHNCMIDSSACTSIMPKRIVDQLGIRYEPVTNGIIQLNGSSYRTVVVFQDLEVTLHACLGQTIVQDIIVIDLPTHSTIFLSKYFTTKISSGCIAIDWSQIFFKDRNGTKTFIMVYTFNIKHVEPYMVDPSYMNCTIFDREEGHCNLFRHDEAESGVYVIHDLNVVIPNLFQAENVEVPPNSSLAECFEHQVQVEKPSDSWCYQGFYEEIFFFKDTKGGSSYQDDRYEYKD